MAAIDPIRFKREFWPHIDFYAKQEEIIYSVKENVETYVPAGNKLGKDFVAGFVALETFLTAPADVRVLTTSVKDDHLRVLWGEIGRWIETSVMPLRVEDGGLLVVKHRDLRLVRNGREDRFSYCIGEVCARAEAMAGHHADTTLAIIDEASGVDESVYDQIRTWAKRILILGNPNPTSNFFRRGVEAGDMLNPA